MYRMIGADSREYGPVAADQIRQWMAEGRANAQTLVRRDGSNEWKPLAEFPELAQPAPSSAPPPIPVTRPNLKSRIAAGLLGVFLGGWGVHRFYLGFVGIGLAQLIVTLFTCGIGALWGFIEGILILTGNINTDAQGRPLQD